MTDPPADIAEAAAPAYEEANRRDRLLSALNLLLAAALFLGAPFALQAGAPFFLPVVSAAVVALILIPLVDWLERRRVPAGVAALLALIAFIAIAGAIVIAIVIPASDWIAILPKQVGRAHANLQPVLDVFSAIEHIVRRLGRSFGVNARFTSSMLELPGAALTFAGAAPVAMFRALFTLLLSYFLLTTYSGVRDGLLMRQAAPGTHRISRLTREVVRSTGSYILTIALVNLCLGAAVALMAAVLGLPTPLMWGGFAALFNFVPYAGPVLTGLLLLVGGLVSMNSAWSAAIPAGAFLMMHLVEANIITPALVGRRLTVNPLLILLSLSFWGWVWGVVGALLSVPLLIAVRVFLHHVGTPDLVGFLFRQRTLVRED